MQTVCQNNDLNRSKRLHRKKLNSIKSTIDMSPPKSSRLKHMKKNMKKEQMLRGKAVQYCIVAYKN